MTDLGLVTILRFREGTCDESNGYRLWSSVTDFGPVESLKFKGVTYDELDSSERNQCQVDKSLIYL